MLLLRNLFCLSQVCTTILFLNTLFCISEIMRTDRVQFAWNDPVLAFHENIKFYLGCCLKQQLTNMKHRSSVTHSVFFLMEIG